MFSRIMTFYKGCKKFGKMLYISKYTLVTIKAMNKNLGDC